MKHLLTKHETEIPLESDLEGSLAAILRLQRVYNISTSQIYAGNYSGYIGPTLSPLDAYDIGRRAFVDGMLKQSVDWLETARMQMQRARMTSQEVGSKPAYSAMELSSVLSLLGRVYIWVCAIFSLAFERVALYNIASLEFSIVWYLH